MKKISICIIIVIIGTIKLAAQRSYKRIVGNPITQEYFFTPLKEEFKAKYPKEPKNSEPDLVKAFKRTIDDCPNCFPSSINSECKKCDSENNTYKIDFKYYATANNYFFDGYRDLIFDYIENGRWDYEEFVSQYKYYLRKAGIKKKDDIRKTFDELVKKRDELGEKISDIYSNFEYKIRLWEAFGKEYELLYSSNYKAMKDLVLNKISPNFNALDNILVYPKLVSKTNTPEENEALKKELLEKGWVKIEEQRKTSDGFTLIVPEVTKGLKSRARQINNYFGTRDFNHHWDQNARVYRLWYGSLETKFALENFLAVCGDNVPSKEAFLENEDKLKELIEGYTEDVLRDRVGKDIVYDFDEELKKRPKEILFDNIVNNHYGIGNADIKKIRKEQNDIKEAEESEKGGALRGNTYYKITSQGYFERIQFTYSLKVDRKVNQSQYWGDYEKINGNTFKVRLKDAKTGIELPEFEAKLSSDGKKLYFGNDKIPYKLYDNNESNCLKDIKDSEGDRGGFWLSSDKQESFSTISSNTWKSKITGGIEANGSLYKISNNKYAFVIHKNSWGGKIDNNLVIITTSDNCNTIYYGKGKKKMNLVK